MPVRWLIACAGVGLALLATPAYAQDAPPASEEPASDEPEEGADLNRELRTVEEEVDSLKERVFRSKATLQLLKELVVDGATGGSRVAITHSNQMGGHYRVESVQYYLDGKNVFTKVDPGGELASVKEMDIHEQSVPAGQHTLQVKMVLRGDGQGVFSYLRTYQFNVQSTYTFNVDEGTSIDLNVIADSRGGLRNFVDRPEIRYEERSDTIREE